MGWGSGKRDLRDSVESSILSPLRFLRSLADFSRHACSITDSAPDWNICCAVFLASNSQSDCIWRCLAFLVSSHPIAGLEWSIEKHPSLGALPFGSRFVHLECPVDKPSNQGCTSLSLISPRKRRTEANSLGHSELLCHSRKTYELWWLIAPYRYEWYQKLWLTTENIKLDFL